MEIALETTQHFALLFQFMGRDCMRHCQSGREKAHIEALKTVDELRGTRNTIYISKTSEEAKREAKLVFDFADMSLSS